MRVLMFITFIVYVAAIMLPFYWPAIAGEVEVALRRFIQ